MVGASGIYSVSYQDLMRQNHYLGAFPKIGEILRYVAAWYYKWAVLLSYS